MATGFSGGAAIGVPSMFLGALDDQPTPIDPFRDAVLEGIEEVGDEPCYVVSGKSAFFDSTLWISTESFLLLRSERRFEDPSRKRPPAEFSDDDVRAWLGELGLTDTPENRRKVLSVVERATDASLGDPSKGTLTETHTSITTPDLTNDAFTFTPPEGTARKDDLFDAMPNIGQE
jgi:hypothetical protein